MLQGCGGDGAAQPALTVLRQRFEPQIARSRGDKVDRGPGYDLIFMQNHKTLILKLIRPDRAPVSQGGFDLRRNLQIVPFQQAGFHGVNRISFREMGAPIKSQLAAKVMPPLERGGRPRIANHCQLPAPIRGMAGKQESFNLFTGKAMCASCHFLPTYAGYVPPAFVESESEILGVPVKPVLKGATLDPDPGRAAGVLRDRSAIYRFSFKTPTLRNIALTAPYMHNGAYDTLEEVVDFYNAGGGRGIGIELDHQTLPFDSLHLTTGERADLVAFLRSLTDTTGVTTRPVRLPSFNDSQLDQRPIGGVY